MSSYYARHHQLRPQTLHAYNRYNNGIRDRLYFYTCYFNDVVPYGITVNHVQGVSSGSMRRVLELRTHTGRLFMYGLVSMEHNTSQLTSAAADEAYEKFIGGYFARDDGAWRFFTCLTQVRLYACFDGNYSWEFQGLCHPIHHVRELARWLQNQYDSLASL